ncbi:MAG: glycosyltransferase [Fibrobacterota bacterium]
METPAEKSVPLTASGPDTSEVRLSVVIVSYNVSGYLNHCLDSVFHACQGFTHEVIVVDNASTDNTLDMIREKYPAVRLVENPQNVGYSRANNQGILIARGRYILLLNPDTIVPSQAFRLSMGYLDTHPETGLMSLKIVNADGSFQPACRRGFPTPMTAFYRMVGLSGLFPKSARFGRYNLTFLDENAESEVDAVCGAYMMARGDILKKTGGFDEKFFMYGEDIDLCFRVKTAGYGVAYFPACEVIHFKGESSRKNRLQSAAHFYNSMFIFTNKYFGQRMGFFPKSVLFLGIFLNAFVKLAADWTFKGAAGLLDAAILNAALAMALILKFGGPPNFYAFTEPRWILLLHASLTGSFLVTLTVHGVYTSAGRPFREHAKAILIASVLFFAFVYFIPNVRFSRLAFLGTGVAALVLLPGWRFALRPLALLLRTPLAVRRRFVILGTGPAAQRVFEKLCQDDAQKKAFLGFLNYGSETSGVDPARILDRVENLQAVVKSRKVNEVIIAENGSAGTIALVNYCTKNNISLKMVQSIHGQDKYYLLDVKMSEHVIL